MREYLLEYNVFDEEEVDRILPHFTARTFRKKEVIVRGGELTHHVYFILRGCVRSFLIDYGGKEHTILFGTEGYWVGDLQAFTAGSATSYNYQALEATEVMSIGKSSWDSLMISEPSFVKYVAMLFRNALIVQQERLVEVFTLPAEQRYERFIDNRSDLLHRVPQKYIASYIGITPEFLSQIRKKASRA
ncbi:MAG: Crp/Fnr family transcriptional regulator [Bacteroidota bacterium]